MKQNTLLNNREWLEKEVKNKSLRIISRELDVSYSRVQGTVKKFNIQIPKRTKHIYTEESRKALSENTKLGLKRRYPDGRYGELASNWRGGKPKCIVCGKTLSRKDAIRCKKHEGENRIGENNVNWQGGIAPINPLIRSTKEFKTWRKAIYERDNYTCQAEGCGKSFWEDSITIHADHYPKPFSVILKENNINTVEKAINCNELWDLNNGRVLCEECHKKTETYAGKLNKFT